MKLSTFFKVAVFFVSLLFVAYTAFATDKGRPYYEEHGYVMWDINTEEKVIALTFDDGPHEKYTPQVLDLLERYEAKATFFVIGENAEKYPDLILRMGEEGHEIANHTYSHPLHVTPSELREELKKTNDIIQGITGTYPVFYRPVAGAYNDKIINTAIEEGYRVVLWSWHLDTQDWKTPGVKKIVNKVLKGASPGDIVLFHDAGGNRTQTVKALKEILVALKAQGYRFVTVSELAEIQSFKQNPLEEK